MLIDVEKPDEMLLKEIAERLASKPKWIRRLSDRFEALGEGM